MRAKRVTEAILAPESESHLVGFCIFSALQNLAQKSFLGTWRKRVNPSSHLPKTEVKNLTASFINLLKSFLHSFEDLQNLLRISTSALARSKGATQSVAQLDILSSSLGLRKVKLAKSESSKSFLSWSLLGSLVTTTLAT